MSKGVRTALVWLLLVVVFVAIYAVVREDGTEEMPRQPGAVLYEDLASGMVVGVSVDHQNRVYVQRVDGSEYAVDLHYTEPLDQTLEAAGVPIGWRDEPSEERGSSNTWLIALVAIVVFLGLVVFYVRRARQAGAATVFALRKTTARLVSDTPKVGWADVGGAADAKAYLKDTVDFLLRPAKWEAAGARPPRGILLEGPPGFGKTLLAKALAGEAKLPFFEVTGSEFVELFVGVGAARVRDLFDEAKKKAPCVVFIDELDAIGRKRGGAGASLTHQEREQALDQMLVCLDGFAGRSRVVVVAATNRADVLDPALLRPGRFDIVLRVGDFSDADRVAILELHSRNKPLGDDVELEAIAALVPDASGADLEQICNAAAMRAARRGGSPVKILQSDFESAAASQAPKSTQLDKLDTFLVAASSGVAQPTSSLLVSVELRSGESRVGIIVWADPFSLKLKTTTGTTVLSRAQIVSITPEGKPAAIGPHDLLRVETVQQPDAG
jgi:cell division protease FtsH